LITWSDVVDTGKHGAAIAAAAAGWLLTVIKTMHLYGYRTVMMLL